MDSSYDGKSIDEKAAKKMANSLFAIRSSDAIFGISMHGRITAEHWR